MTAPDAGPSHVPGRTPVPPYVVPLDDIVMTFDYQDEGTAPVVSAAWVDVDGGQHRVEGTPRAVWAFLNGHRPADPDRAP